MTRISAKTRLRTLRRIDMQEWLSALRAAGYSNSTIHAARTVLGMVLTSATDARIIAGNPLTGLRLPKVSSRTHNAPDGRAGRSHGRRRGPVVAGHSSSCSPTAGCVPGKPSPFAAEHLDDLGRLTVEAGMTEHRGVLLERDTKTHRSRVVEVPASVFGRNCGHTSSSVSGKISNALVFTTPFRRYGATVELAAPSLGSPRSRVRLSEWATPYVLRHTAASLLAERRARDRRGRVPRP